ncbi:MAG: rod shape-determining protein RodA [Patescibacteria group bacterium]
MNALLSKLRKLDWIVFSCIFLLVCFGLVAIYSVTLSTENPDWFNLTKQLIAFGIGLVLFFTLSLVDFRVFKTYARWFYWSGIILLLLVLLVGVTLRGTRGWFNLVGFNFQPIELMKILLIIYLAYYFSKQRRPLNQLKYLIITGLVTILPFILTVLQPDFGSALILVLIWFGLVLAIGLARYQWLSLIVLGVITFLVAWNFVFVDYQKERVLTFLDSRADPLGAGYNVTQSMIAIGSGRLIGRGVGFGSQSQLKFLPAAQTDFIFAVIAEELGLLGIFLVLGLFFLIFYRLFRLIQRARDDFGLFLVLGVMLLLFIEMFLNIAVNLGLAPVTGITLPLVSYGGSSLIFTLAALGLVQSVKIRN